MSDRMRVLIVEDVPTDAELVEYELRNAGMEFSAKRVETKRAYIEALSTFFPDVILSDYSLPAFDGITALQLRLERAPDTPFIFVTGALGEELAIDLLKQGATDYVLKNRLSRLSVAVNRALREVEERRERERTRAELERVEMQRRENERWVVLGQMTSGIAHDIRNPINFVSLALEHISGKKQTGTDKATRKLIEDAHSELMRVNEMIQGVLEYGRTKTLNLQVENANGILADSVRQVTLHHPDRKCPIRLEEVEDSFPIYVERDLLQRVVTNLLENALEAGGPEAVVKTGAKYDSGKREKVVLWIQDSGPGIPEPNLEKIFTPFFTTKKSGIGLGLTLAHKWVREMGGEIRASNAPEGGARFEIHFSV
jgi:two-component system, NtrC family, sensor kinase